MSEDPDRERGLYGKYRVEKVNGKPVGRCFVLAYDNDRHARVALAAYADSCEAEFPQLAADLRRELNTAYLDEIYDPDGILPPPLPPPDRSATGLGPQG